MHSDYLLLFLSIVMGHPFGIIIQKLVQYSSPLCRMSSGLSLPSPPSLFLSSVFFLLFFKMKLKLRRIRSLRSTTHSLPPSLKGSAPSPPSAYPSGPSHIHHFLYIGLLPLYFSFLNSSSSFAVLVPSQAPSLLVIISNNFEGESRVKI